MSLENIFKNVEKPEEKKINLVRNEEQIFDDIMLIFQENVENIFTPIMDFVKNNFRKCYNLLKTYDITPEIIRKFSEKDLKLKNDEYTFKGVYLSALIQRSYDLGYNNFELDQIYMQHFGSFLKGKEENPIKIKMRILEWSFGFSFAENCHVIVDEKIDGYGHFWSAKNCFAETNLVRGSHTFIYAKNSVFKIKESTASTLLNNVENCSLIADYVSAKSGFMYIKNCHIKIRNFYSEDFYNFFKAENSFIEIEESKGKVIIGIERKNCILEEKFKISKNKKIECG